MPIITDYFLQAELSMACYSQLANGTPDGKKIGVRPRFEFDDQKLALPPIFVHARRLLGIRGASPIRYVVAVSSRDTLICGTVITSS
jgi:hypothetical protein